ncbi:DUF2939 domain-containing protein [Lichenicoccus sp.]|uniref:DUF2939 domain-containing protein n=1 Tax=Lichenicoccus sp. TaxID=2781899 RepID=UPI003D0CE0A0
MLRFGSTPPVARCRRSRRARRVALSTLALSGMIFAASPYVALWSAGYAVSHHDRAALRGSLDWQQVRLSLKHSFGLTSPGMGVRQVAQQDELPDFGESFATNVASGMIDDDITPERLDGMLSRIPAGARTTRMPHGFFTGPASFIADIPVANSPPVRISMRIEQWHWKIIAIGLPASLLAPASQTRFAQRS